MTKHQLPKRIWVEFLVSKKYLDIKCDSCYYAIAKSCNNSQANIDRAFGFHFSTFLLILHLKFLI